MSEFIADDQQPETPQAQPQFISPARGFHWLERGLSEIYVPHFGQWFLAALVLQSLAALGAMLNPNVGLLFQVLMPIFMAGGIIGAHAIHNKESINAAQFLKAFVHPKKLSILGLALLQVVLFAAIAYAIVSVIGADRIMEVDWAKTQQPEHQAYAQSVWGELLIPNLKWIIGGIALYMMATWFANCLLILNNSNPLTSLTNGFVGFVKNILGFLVLLIIMVLIFIILGIVGSLVGGLVTAALGVLGALIVQVLLGALIVPLLVSVTYISYREIFLGDVKKSETSL